MATADEIETRVEQELSERFPPRPEAELAGVTFAGDPYLFEIHLQDNGVVSWIHRGGEPTDAGTTTLPSGVASQMATAIRGLLDREQWLLNRLVEREQEVARLKRTNG